MANVIFVAPFFLEATLRFVDAVADTPGVTLVVISQDSEDKLPPVLKSKIAATYRIADGLDPQQIADAVREIAGAIGTVHRLLGTLEQLQVPLAEVREALHIEGMGVGPAINFRDKARMKTVMREADVPCARHLLAHSTGDAQRFVEEVSFPVVVKPQAGAGALATFRLDSVEDLSRWLSARPPGPDSPALMEEFMSGLEHSFDSVFIRGELVWHSVSRYFPTPLEVLQEPWIQWVVVLPREIDTDEFAEIRELGPRALKALGMTTGLSHMEWFRRPDGSIAISEVAARPPGAQITSLISYAYDSDFYKLWAHLMIYEQFDPPERKYATGAAYLRGQGTGRVQAIHGISEVQAELGHLVVEAKLPEIGQSPAGTYEGEGYVIVRDHDTSVIEDALRKIIGSLQIELAE